MFKRCFLCFLLAVFLLYFVSPGVFAQEPRYRFGDDTIECDDEACAGRGSSDRPLTVTDYLGIFGVVALPALLVILDEIKKWRAERRWKRDWERFHRGEIDEITWDR